MHAAELVAFASASLSTPDPASVEAFYRRSISACYYALFHRLAEAGAKAFSKAGVETSRQAQRAFKHTEMRMVCERYRGSAAGRPLAFPLGKLVGRVLDPRLFNVARAFVKLQEFRENADYDLTTVASEQDAREALALAQEAWADFDAIEHEPATQTFLTALLMADRWKRGG